MDREMAAQGLQGDLIQSGASGQSLSALEWGSAPGGEELQGF